MDNHKEPRVTEQATDEQSNVLPPFAAPARRVSINERVTFQGLLVDLICSVKKGENLTVQSGKVQALTDFIDSELELASRFRAQGGNTSANSSESLAAQAAHDGADTERDAARFQWIEENCRTEGGGHGFTVFVPVDHEDIGCGIDAAIATSAKESSQQENVTTCDHIWPESEGQTDIYGNCEKCGMFFQRYIHTEMP